MNARHMPHLSARTRPGPRLRLLATSLLCLAAWTAVSIAPARATAAPVDITRDAPRNTSLTLSLAALAWRTLELTWERHLGRDLAVAAVVGAGRGAGFGDSQDRTLVELGVQARYYAAGSFEDGLAVGLEVMGLWLTADSAGYEGKGLAVGPLLAFKMATRWGPTLDVQLGLAWVGYDRGLPDDPTRLTKSGLQPMGSLNAGWTF